MTVFFTSDTHFGHAGALGFFGRPFRSVAEMDRTLIENWNAAVGPSDEVWHLGDFALRHSPARMAEILGALDGRKRLVFGNNDTEATKALAGWTSVAPYAELELSGVRLVLCHYPFRSWNGQAKGALDLHGHSHGRLAPLPRQIDVGVDAWAFRPATLPQLLERAAAKRRPGGRKAEASA
jgi:calcineurin-like phosphoesterase family protein